MVKVSGSPSGGRAPRSSLGSPTGAMSAALIASTYQRPIVSRTASSRTASRPMRRMITGAGTLPLRNPGTRRLAPSWRAVCWIERSTSSAGTSASTRTRDSGSSVTVVLTAVVTAAPDDTVRAMERLATWLVTGPLGHLAGGVLDWGELLGRYWIARATGRAGGLTRGPPRPG